MIVKRFGCTTIHKKRYINASFIIIIMVGQGVQGAMAKQIVQGAMVKLTVQVAMADQGVQGAMAE